jgi:hypothetical protein
MNRPLLFAAFVVLLASLASVPLLAQHGGGHASGGGHGGMAAHGSFSGHGGSGHALGGMRSGSNLGSRAFSRGSGFNRGFAGRSFNHSNSFRLRTYGFRNCFGYPCRGAYGYPWLYGGALDPYWWNSGSSYDQEQQYQTGLANEMNQQSLEEQRMREQGDQDAYARSAPPPPRQHQEERTEAAPATVLVFRDQHQQEVQNYAIVGQTLWTFDPKHTQKIPLSDLDIPATTKANDANGVDFHLPGSHEGQ